MRGLSAPRKTSKASPVTGQGQGGSGEHQIPATARVGMGLCRKAKHNHDP
jgi:hypothetical protein